MISIYRFKALVRRYREVSKIEISNFAIDYNYTQYQLKNKTPLIEGMEKHFGKSLDELKPNPLMRDALEETQIVKPRFQFSEIKDKEVLPFAKNRDTRTKSNALAYANGYKFFIGKCQYHEDTLYIVKSTSHFCSICRYSQHKDEIKAVVARLINISTKKEKSSEAAS